MQQVLELPQAGREQADLHSVLRTHGTLDHLTRRLVPDRSQQIVHAFERPAVDGAEHFSFMPLEFRHADNRPRFPRVDLVDPDLQSRVGRDAHSIIS